MIKRRVAKGARGCALALLGPADCAAPRGVASPASCPFVPALTTPLDTVDLVLRGENTNSDRDNEAHLLTQLGPMIDALVNPLCIATVAGMRRDPPADARGGGRGRAGDRPV